MTLAEYLEAMLNGAPVTEGGAEPTSELEALIEEQLRLMAKQIELLHHAPTQNGVPSHE
jgi:hypothetical protein